MTIHRVNAMNLDNDQVVLLRDYGKSASSRMNVDPVSYCNSINRGALSGTIARIYGGTKDNSSDCYTANKPLSENNSEKVPA